MQYSLGTWAEQISLLSCLLTSPVKDTVVGYEGLSSGLQSPLVIFPQCGDSLTCRKAGPTEEILKKSQAPLFRISSPLMEGYTSEVEQKLLTQYLGEGRSSYSIGHWYW